MREKTVVYIITGIIFLVFISAFFVYPNLEKGSFNFNRVDLEIDGLKVNEKLYFSPNTNYHTLYRTFEDTINVPSETLSSNSIIVSDVECSDGEGYISTYEGFYDSEAQSRKYLAYTEENEYGCSFGNEYGFFSGNSYWIRSKMELNPENLFLIDEDYYVKFIAYSSRNHYPLRLDDNLFITGSGIVVDESYAYNEDVIFYIPYYEDRTGYNIIEQDDFDFDGRFNLIGFIVSFLPGLAFFFSWYYFGRERSFKDIPESGISYPPCDRKPWEVALYFHPMFSQLDKNFFSAMFLELYRRKIIDIKIIRNDLYLKISEKNVGNLDEVEKDFLEILRFMVENSKEKYFDKKYLNFTIASKKLASDLTYSFNRESYKKLKEYTKSLRKFRIKASSKGNDYIEMKGGFVALLLVFLTNFVGVPLGFNIMQFILNFVLIFFVGYLTFGTTILSRYKEDYYSEYLHWKGFKKYLDAAPSLKEHGHKGVVLWEKYLTYGVALGVSKRVLKELGKKGFVDKQYSNVSSGISAMPSSSFGGVGGSSGSGGGAGGGGVGGGGGGGR